MSTSRKKPLRKRSSRITAAMVHRFRESVNNVELFERGMPRPGSYAEIFKQAIGRVNHPSPMAMDAMFPSTQSSLSFLGPIDPSILPFSTKFIGYAALATLRQNILIQNIVGTYAEEMTKKWVEVKGEDEGENPISPRKAGKTPGQSLKTPREAGNGLVEAEMDDEGSQLAEDAKRVAGYGKKWKAESLFRDVMEEVGFSGGCLVFIDNGDTNLTAPLPLNKRGIPKGSLKGFKIIEPMNVYPISYNAYDPLAQNYFTPTSWMVMNRRVHASRFLYFAQNNLPFLLKPAYNFMGIPLPQMILDYLYNFERSRDAAARLIRNYSKRIISTDMSSILLSGLCDDDEEMEADALDVESIFNRVRIMQSTEDNDGYLLLDKEKEEFQQMTTSLAGMMEMVSQQMELLALVAKIPVTKLFGTPPRGFNATGDSEKEDFANFISGMRKKILHENVEKFYKIIQLNEAGYSVDELEYVWPDLREPTDEQKATIRQQDAQTGSTLVQAGIIDAIEERQRLAATEGSGYQFIDAEDWEEPEEEAGMELSGEGGGEGEGETAPPSGQANDEEVEVEDEWKTIRGTHVDVGEGGEITKGPAALKALPKRSSVSSQQTKPTATSGQRLPADYTSMSKKERQAFVEANAKNMSARELQRRNDVEIDLRNIAQEKKLINFWKKSPTPEVAKERIALAKKNIDRHEKSIAETMAKDSKNGNTQTKDHPGTPATANNAGSSYNAKRRPGGTISTQDSRTRDSNGRFNQGGSERDNAGKLPLRPKTTS